MPDSTSSVSPQDSFISSNGTEQWNRDNTNIIQNATISPWTGVENQNMIPVSPNIIVNQSFIANGNEINGPTNYVNLQYPRTSMQNNFPVLPNAQNITPMPGMMRAVQRGQPQLWASQQNLNLIQTAWNKNPSGGAKKPKRVRTAFTSRQMMELEQEYTRTKYLDRSRRIELSESLRLNERTIKIWFQNRRMKEKKDKIENNEGIEDVSTTQPPPEFGSPILVQDQYQANGESNRMGMFVEQYPVSSSSVPMAPIPQVQMIVPGSYAAYIPESCPPEYQQHFQVQYPCLYGEVQEVSPESTSQSERSVSLNTSSQSERTDKSWDLSWIRSMEAEEEC